MKFITFMLAVLLSAPAFAQHVPPAREPELTEVQKLRVERINLVAKIAELEKAQAELRVELAALKLSIERAALQADVQQTHPDYVWEPTTGKFLLKSLPAPPSKSPGDGELR